MGPGVGSGLHPQLWSLSFPWGQALGHPFRAPRLDLQPLRAPSWNKDRARGPGQGLSLLTSGQLLAPTPGKRIPFRLGYQRAQTQMVGGDGSQPIVTVLLLTFPASLAQRVSGK